MHQNGYFVHTVFNLFGSVTCTSSDLKIRVFQEVMLCHWVGLNGHCECLQICSVQENLKIKEVRSLKCWKLGCHNC